MYKRSARWFALVLVVGVAACSPGACAERMVEEAIEAETGGEVDLDSEAGTMSVTGPDGESMEIGESVALPDDLPSFLPVYPDSTPRMVLRTGEGAQITLEVAEDASTVVSWYREQLVANGFEIQSDMAGPMGTVTMVAITARVTGVSVRRTIVVIDGTMMNAAAAGTFPAESRPVRGTARTPRRGDRAPAPTRGECERRRPRRRQRPQAGPTVDQAVQPRPKRLSRLRSILQVRRVRPVRRATSWASSC